MTPSHARPKVVIGLPVYNGERYLAKAIEAILDQTYEHLELVISDNASTDATETICRRYANRDPRIRYLRQPVNLGAAGNFNRLFEMAGDSDYFKWASHDDWIASGYVEACVRELESQPEAVLCQSFVQNVNAAGERLGTYDHTAAGSDAPRPSDRFRARLESPRCMEVFGLIRSNVLGSTGLIASYSGGDRTLLLDLALAGPYAVVEECLFFHRIHNESYSLSVCGRQTPKDELAWYAPAASKWNTLSAWTLYRDCLRVIRRRLDDRAERFRCYGHLLRTLKSWRRCLTLAIQPFLAMDERVFHGFNKLKAIKRRAFGYATASPERWFSENAAVARRGGTSGAAAAMREPENANALFDRPTSPPVRGDVAP